MTMPHPCPPPASRPGTLSTRSLGALRAAATLAHALPRLRVRIQIDGQTALEVRDPRTHDHPSTTVLTMSPCAFHKAVSCAHRKHRTGRRLSFLGLEASQGLTVEIGTPHGGAARPGGLYRVPLGERWLWAFSTTLPAPIAFELGRPVLNDFRPRPSLVALGVRADEGTGITITYAETFARPCSAEESEVVDVLESLLACWTTHELLTSTVDGAVRP